MRNKYNLLFLWPAIGLIGSSIVFLYQGGFGGGHGLDFWFVIFGFPGVYLLWPIEMSVLSDYILQFNDYVHIVLYPVIFNFILISIFLFLKRRLNLRLK